MPAALAICRMIKTFLQVYPILNVIRMFANLLKFLKKSRASRSCQERLRRDGKAADLWGGSFYTVKLE